jgi:hypothetical protein
MMSTDELVSERETLVARRAQLEKREAKAKADARVAGAYARVETDRRYIAVRKADADRYSARAGGLREEIHRCDRRLAEIEAGLHGR